MGGPGDGLSRKQSSLELLCHTAVLKDEIDEKERTETSPFSRNLVSPQDSAARLADAQAFSIEGYPSTESEDSDELPPGLSPVQPFGGSNDKRSAFEARGYRIVPLPSLLSSHDSCQSLGRLIGSSSSSSYLTGLMESTGNIKDFSPKTNTSERIFGKNTKVPNKDNGQAQASNSFKLLPKDSQSISDFSLLLLNSGVRRSDSSSDMLLSPPRSRSSSIDDLERENAELRKLMKVKNETIVTLTSKIDELEKHVQDLRQLPTGKISQIPLE